MRKVLLAILLSAFLSGCIQRTVLIEVENVNLVVSGYSDLYEEESTQEYTH